MDSVEYQRKVIGEIADELNALQMKYDSKLLALCMADRAGYLLSLLQKAGQMSQQEAISRWLVATERVMETPETVTQLHIADGEVYDPKKVN